MAITETQTEHQVRNVAVGRHIDTGTVAARKFTTGFKPRYVKIVNVTDRIQEEWLEGMDAASGLLQIANGTKTLITSNGITVANDGFTLGLDTTIYITNKQYSWVAMG